MIKCKVFNNKNQKINLKNLTIPNSNKRSGRVSFWLKIIRRTKPKRFKILCWLKQNNNNRAMAYKMLHIFLFIQRRTKRIILWKGSLPRGKRANKKGLNAAREPKTSCYIRSKQWIRKNCLKFLKVWNSWRWSLKNESKH